MASYHCGICSEIYVDGVTVFTPTVRRADGTVPPGLLICSECRDDLLAGVSFDVLIEEFSRERRRRSSESPLPPGEAIPPPPSWDEAVRGPYRPKRRSGKTFRCDMCGASDHRGQTTADAMVCHCCIRRARRNDCPASMKDT